MSFVKQADGVVRPASRSIALVHERPLHPVQALLGSVEIIHGHDNEQDIDDRKLYQA